MSNTITETIPALRANLDVTELEAKVLIPVFLGGNMTAGAVALVSEETITKVERALKRLQKKGLVTKIDGVVPIYRPVPLGLTFSERLGTLVTDVNGFAESSYESLDTDIEATSETASSVVKQAEKSSKRIESDLSSCEDEMLEAVKSQTETVSEIARASLEEFSNSMESALSEIDVTMEESLGDNMSQLHAELDKGQQEIEQDVERISTELEQELEERKASAVDSVKVFGEDADRLLETAESAVADAVSESTDIIRKASKKTSEQLTNDTTQLSQEVVETINRASADLNDTVDKMDRDISIAHDEAQEALSKLVIDIRSMTQEHAQLARDKIQSTLRESRAMNEAFGAWREEVATYMDSASRSMHAQLDKVESTDKNYIDALQTTISGHLDKVDSLVGEEYTDLKEIASAVETNFSEFVEETKITLLSFLRKRLKESRQNLDSGRAKLEDDLEEMVAETTEAIDTRLSDTANQVGEVLVTRENELKTLTEKTQNEITSTFGTVVTNTSNKNDAI
ncbi:MAG: helix-turn-helix domain-containing protein, partial [Candidatus Thorarchaeota archaeon]